MIVDSLLSRIEDAGLNASAPTQQLWVDGWLVRLSPGKAQRARCINAVSEGRLSIDERIAICRAMYRRAGLPMLVRITPFTRPSGLDDWLAGQGFTRFDDTSVMARDHLVSLADVPLPSGLIAHEVSSEAYAHIVGEFRGTPLLGRQAHAERLSSSPVPYRALVLRQADGTVLACAQSARETDRVGLYDVFTSPAARGRGLSSFLCGRLLSDARQEGAKAAYLQVDAQNHAARSVYRRMGFADVYHYHYRAAPGDPVAGQASARRGPGVD